MLKDLTAIKKMCINNTWQAHKNIISALFTSCTWRRATKFPCHVNKASRVRQQQLSPREQRAQCQEEGRHKTHEQTTLSSRSLSHFPRSLSGCATRINPPYSLSICSALNFLLSVSQSAFVWFYRWAKLIGLIRRAAACELFSPSVAATAA
jgi:hypothetical protein